MKCTYNYGLKPIVSLGISFQNLCSPLRMSYYRCLKMRKLVLNFIWLVLNCGIKRQRHPFAVGSSYSGLNKRKGAAPTIMTIILILVLLFFLVVFLYYQAYEKNKVLLLNFREGEILRLANTYEFLNRTLGMTWHVSAVQSVFNATDQSLLCGIDDAELLGYEALPPKYWYQHDRKNGPKSIDKARAFESNPDGNRNKYNADEPSVCYPTNENAIKIIEGSFNEFMDIDSELSANELSIKISPKETTFVLNQEGVEAVSKQGILLKSTNGEIEESTTNVNQIYTEFPRMINFGRSLVHALTGLADAFYPNEADKGFSYEFSFKYRDLDARGYPPDASKDSYLDRMSELLRKEIITAEENSLDRATASIKYDKLELFVPHESGDENVFNAPQGFQGGLALHYDITVTLNEGGVIGGACKYPPPNNYGELIEQAVNEKEWKFGDFEYADSEIVAFVSAIIQQESSWNLRAISGCGAAGLGQLMAGTAHENGINVIFEDARFVECDSSGYADRLKAAIEGVTDENLPLTDERFDPEKNIKAAVSYIHKLFGNFNFDDYTTDKTELLKFVAASYNTGPERIKNAILNAVFSGIGENNVRFDDIKAFLPPKVQAETIPYVLAVSGFYICYGGSLPVAGDFYYYHDEKGSRFFRKPFSMGIKAEDYLPAIDCNDLPDPTPSVVRFFSWEEPRDMVCCGGILWACNADVPGIGSRRLDTGSTAGGTCGDVLGRAGFTLVCGSGGFFLNPDSAPLPAI